MNDLHTKHRAIGGPLDGDPIYTDSRPASGAELIHDTDKCEHTYVFTGRVWRHERAVILSRNIDECGK